MHSWWLPFSELDTQLANEIYVYDNTVQKKSVYLLTQLATVIKAWHVVPLSVSEGLEISSVTKINRIDDNQEGIIIITIVWKLMFVIFLI